MEVIEVTEREVEIIEVIERGPQGVAGAAGAVGPQGPAGTTDYNNLTNKPTLGTAAAADIGTGAGQVAEGNHTHTSFSSLRIDPANGNVGFLVVGNTTSGQNDYVTIDDKVRLKSSTNSFKAAIDASALSADRTATLPNASGTIALTSDFAAPPAIGNTTPNSGAFTTLSASTSLTLGTSGILSGGTNLIEQRNTTSAQTFRIYNTVSGAADANYERGKIAWESNVLRIGTEKAGTGSVRAMEFQTDGTTRLTIAGNGSALTVNTTSLRIQSTSSFEFGFSRSRLTAPADSQLLIQNSTSTDFDRIMFGGTTSSFPALKRSSTTLQVRLANDSDFAPFACAGLTLNGNLDASTRNIVTDTTTGTRIGTATTQLLGFWNAAPSAQPAAVADATDAASTQARLNDLLARLRTIGIIAT